MKPLSYLFVSCCVTSLLAGCPTSPEPSQVDESSTGSDTTASGPTTSTQTTAVDSTSSTTAPETSESSSSSSDSGPPPGCVADEDCDNGSFCDGLEGCVDGECVASAPIDCDDGIDCTVDSCDDEAGECLHDPDNTVCGCAETCDTELGCGNHCIQTECNGQVYECGDCIDNDDDCGIDNYDDSCWGPCDNNEGGWSGEVPGQQNQSECTAMDCYFDQDSGSGNDDCYWSHTCDPLEPTGCAHNPNYNVPGSGTGCSELQMTQSMDCLDFCGPRIPNGCDCFGCCDVTAEDGTQVTIYLGTRDPITDVGTCNLQNALDPVLCNPCTQVDSCINDCGMCEICIGQQELPPGCEEQECPPALQTCGQPGQDPCPMGTACITGCCVPEPQ